MECIVKILDVSREPPSALLQVTFRENESVIIRWGLDSDSYGPLKRAFEENFFDSLAVHETYLPLTYETSAPKGSPDREVYAHIEKVSGQRRKQIKVPCSEHFAGNLKWFQESVRGPKDLEHLVATE